MEEAGFIPGSPSVFHHLHFANRAFTLHAQLGIGRKKGSKVSLLKSPIEKLQLDHVFLLFCLRIDNLIVGSFFPIFNILFKYYSEQFLLSFLLFLDLLVFVGLVPSFGHIEQNIYSSTIPRSTKEQHTKLTE